MRPFLHRWTERVRKGEPIPLPLAALLTAATPLVRAGMGLRSLRTPVRVDARVISFGNITAGGTGKTPAVIERARAEIAAGRKVAVLTRGYGARKQRAPIVATHAQRDANLYRIVGDEPALIARSAPGVIVVKCADRVAAARTAIEQHGCDVLILDDGFQYLRLARDENVVVVDATNPFGNGRLIPRGILREPLTALRRATAFLLTRCDQTRNTAELIERLRQLCPETPVRTTRHAPKAFVRVADETQVPPDQFSGKTVRAVCAIAHPEAFLRTLESLGIRIAERVILPDHQDIPASALTCENPIITTEKDAMRIQSAPPHVWALRIELEDYPVGGRPL